MNRYLFLHRIQGPAMLLTFGFVALLDQWHILGFGRSWPLYLIVLGILKLAQRAALASAEPPPGYPQGYTGYPPMSGAPASPATGSTALIPSDGNTSPQINDLGEGR